MSGCLRGTHWPPSRAHGIGSSPQEPLRSPHSFRFIQNGLHFPEAATALQVPWGFRLLAGERWLLLR